MIRTVAIGEGEPGLRPLGSALEQEGFEDLESGHLVESFARHFMRSTDVWQERGFGEISKNYLARLPPQMGVRRDVDENGDLLVRSLISQGLERRSFTDALATVSWLDPTTRGPRM
jgi:hypothetical protein